MSGNGGSKASRPTEAEQPSEPPPEGEPSAEEPQDQEDAENPDAPPPDDSGGGEDENVANEPLPNPTIIIEDTSLNDPSSSQPPTSPPGVPDTLEEYLEFMNSQPDAAQVNAEDPEGASGSEVDSQSFINNEIAADIGQEDIADETFQPEVSEEQVENLDTQDMNQNDFNPPADQSSDDPTAPEDISTEQAEVGSVPPENEIVPELQDEDFQPEENPVPEIVDPPPRPRTGLRQRQAGDAVNIGFLDNDESAGMPEVPDLLETVVEEFDTIQNPVEEMPPDDLDVVTEGDVAVGDNDVPDQGIEAVEQVEEVIEDMDQTADAIDQPLDTSPQADEPSEPSASEITEEATEVTEQTAGTSEQATGNGIPIPERDPNENEEFDEDGNKIDGWGADPGGFRFTSTPPEGRFHAQNGGAVKFESPKVPVIFVLGGPGSGKVTHCDSVVQEKRGITHINMTDLLQQYTISENKDFSQLSSKTVTEVLMLEMKMAPAAKTFLISGYPRNMRDVVEYSNKIQIVNGVVLVAWRQKVLERQIEYGAKLGHVVLSLARMELNNFYKNVMPVADYFDQRGMLIAVNGERNPAEVFIDFRTAVLRILGNQDKESNGNMIAPIANGEQPLLNGVAMANGNLNRAPAPQTVASVYKPPTKGYPPVIWVLGGPGSNKYTLCNRVIRKASGWVHLSVGRLLRAAAEIKDPMQAAEAGLIKAHLAAGNLVPQNIVIQLVETQMNTNMNAQGIIMDSFPRDIEQLRDFEDKFKQQPVVILLDCSKLQLGRGRLDDSVAAFRRRLELFREHTLPVLKTLDSENRLLIVDGDTDTYEFRDEFNKVVMEEVTRLRKANGLIMPDDRPKDDLDSMLQDLEAEDENIRSMRNAMSSFNPNMTGVAVNSVGVNPANRQEVIRDMYAGVENFEGLNQTAN